MNKFNVGIDFGASQTKILYEKVEEGTKTVKYPEVCLIPSEFIKLPVQSLKQGGIDFSGGINPPPEKSAWIKIRRKDPVGIAIGSLAKRLSIYSQPDPIKIESAIERILAIVSTIANKENCLSMEIKLTILLPYNEYDGREIIEKKLRNKSQTIYWQEEKKIDVYFSEITVSPEGYGGISYFTMTKGVDWLCNRKVAIVMIGYRNASILYLDKGSFAKGNTCDLGYWQMLQSVVKGSIGQEANSEELASVVFELSKKENESKKEILLGSITKSRESSSRKHEIAKLDSAIEIARLEYWMQLSNWLRLQTENKTHNFIFLGGTAQYFREQLNKQLSWTTIDWGDEVITEMQNKLIFPPPKDRQKNQAYRCFDLFCYYWDYYKEHRVFPKKNTRNLKRLSQYLPEIFMHEDNIFWLESTKGKSLREKKANKRKLFTIRYSEGSIVSEIIEYLKEKDTSITTTIRELLITAYGLETIINETENDSCLVNLEKLKLMKDTSINELKTLIKKIEHLYNLYDDNSNEDSKKPEPKLPSSSLVKNEFLTNQDNHSQSFSGARFLPK